MSDGGSPVIVEETVQFKQKLIEALTEEYSEERVGTHVSDLVSCVRKTVFEKLQPMPLSETDVMLFVLGEGHHQIIQTLAGKEGASAEQKVELDGVIGTIDLLENGVPIEIKTRRTKDREPEDIHLVERHEEVAEKIESMSDEAFAALIKALVSRRQRGTRKYLQVECVTEEVAYMA